MAINDPGTSAAVGAAEAAAAVGVPAASGVAAILNATRAVSEAFSAQALAQAKQGAQGLTAAASSGQVRITPEGFDILTKALDACKTHIQDLNRHTVIVAQAPMLGSSPYAKTVAAHVQRGGTGDTQSADIVIDQLNAIFNEVRGALDKAKQAYEDNEHATVHKLSK